MGTTRDVFTDYSYENPSTCCCSLSFLGYRARYVSDMCEVIRKIQPAQIFIGKILMPSGTYKKEVESAVSVLRTDGYTGTIVIINDDESFTVDGSTSPKSISKEAASLAMTVFELG